MAKFKKRILQFLLLFFLWFSIHVILISYDGLRDHIRNADCILILGNKVNENGTLSDRLKARVDKGLELYKLRVSPKIVVSGGLGKEGYYEGTEMKNYLVKNGISESDIIVDNNGVNTMESANSFLSISKEYDFKSVLVVSQFYHISRTKMIFKRKGLSQIFSAHADYYEFRDVYSLIREFFGYYQCIWFCR
jgi:vancomycin permeability regulator SanA